MAAKESGQSEFSSYSGIVDHQGPLKSHDPKYRGSLYNVLVDWDDGMQMWEPLNMIAKQDPVTLTKYAHDHDLLNKPGWKFLQRTAKRYQFVNVIMNAIKRRGWPTKSDTSLVYASHAHITRPLAWTKRMATHFGRMRYRENWTKSLHTNLYGILVLVFPQVQTSRKLR